MLAVHTDVSVDKLNLVATWDLLSIARGPIHHSFDVKRGKSASEMAEADPQRMSAAYIAVPW